MSSVPEMPAGLPEQLRPRWNALAPILAEMGTLRSVDVDSLGRYLLLEWEYAATSKQVVSAINGGDPEEAGRWIGIQDKLHKNIRELAIAFGLDPEARNKRGLILPQDA